MGKSIEHRKSSHKFKTRKHKSANKKSKTRKRNTSIKHGGKITKKSMVGSAIKSIASFVDIDVDDDDIDEMSELISSPEAQKVERTALDAVGVIPGIGEAVEAARVADDVVTMGETAETAVSSVEKISDTAEKAEKAVSSVKKMSNTLSDNKEMFDTFEKHHAVQGKMLDRISQSRENFAQPAPTQDQNQNYNQNQNQNQDQNN